MDNKWHEIWSAKETEMDFSSADTEKIFLELKRLDGWDSVGEEITYDAFFNQYKKIKNELSFYPRNEKQTIKSVFEVGCGSGPMLFLFQRDGFEIGGADYSDSMVHTASKVLNDEKELYCSEACDINTDIKYDAVFSNSVFQYFTTEEYAYKVLEKMFEKTNHSIGILDVYDPKYKEDFVKYRKELNPDFEERYENLSKLFIDKSFFIKFAEERHMDVRFSVADLEGYWNNRFVYDCFMTKCS